MSDEMEENPVIVEYSALEEVTNIKISTADELLDVDKPYKGFSCILFTLDLRCQY